MVKFLLFTALIASNLHGSFEAVWRNMQQEYHAIKQITRKTKKNNMPMYMNEFYKDLIVKLDKLVASRPNANFLKESCLTPIMVRGYVEDLATYEEAFLEYFISEKTKSLIANFKEHSRGLLDQNCVKFNCSSNTLGQLFYVAKVLELSNDLHPNLILEVGGGFGTLAKCFKQILPGSTIIIVDLPEMNVIQKIFLNYTAPDLSVIMHKSNLDSIKPGAINLVPLYLLESIAVQPDLFISTFALSESTEKMQKFIIDKNFFNAKKIYITGQMHGWKGIGFDWIVDHKLIIDAVRNRYSKALCTPFHLFNKQFLSYELYGEAVS